MLQFQEHIPLGPKTTMRIGGRARWYAELKSKEDCEEAVKFADAKKVPLIVLGSGSNTIFADGTIEALVVRIFAQNIRVMPSSAVDLSIHSSLSGARSTRDDTTAHIETKKVLVHVEAGKNLPMLINELAEHDLNLSPLTGIPGTVGGAIFGNAGQGFGGTWISTYVRSVEACIDGESKVFSNEECDFGYRTSGFKKMRNPIIWKVELRVPSCAKEEVKAEVERLLKRRIETQPHVKTAGSCFVSLPDGTPAWKVIDVAGLRGKKVGGVQISEKHANFLIAEKGAKFEDAKALIEMTQKAVGAEPPLRVEMRLIGEKGEILG